MEHKRTAVLELGGSKTVCLAAVMTEEGRIQVESFSSVASRGISKGCIVDVEECARSTTAAIQRVEKELGAHISKFCINLAGKHVRASSSQGYHPLVPANRAIRYDDILSVLNHSRQVLLEPDREQILAVPREYHVDGQRGIVNPLGLVGSRLEVVTTLITASTSAIESIENMLARVGKTAADYLIQPVASAVGAATVEQLEAGCAVIDIGAHLTDIAIYADKNPVYCSCITVGASHISTDISVLIKTEYEEAERVKIEHGTCRYESIGDAEVVQIRQSGSSHPRPLKRRVLAEIIEARVLEIAKLCAKEVEKSGMRGRLPGGIIVTGGGANLEGIEYVFGQAFGGNKVKVGVPKTVGPNSRRLMEPQFATAVGMAKQAIDGDQQEFEPVSGSKSWKDNIRTLQSFFGKKG